VSKPPSNLLKSSDLTKFSISSRADWADDEEFDDPSALPAQQVIANKDGTKTVISYRFNDDNKKVKVTRRIKTTVVREHVNPQVAERRKWEKFGNEKGHAAGPSFDTTSVGENIIFRPSVNWKAQAKEAEKDGGEKGSMKDQLKDKKVKCRICSGEHFTARCPFKDTMAPVEEGTAGAGAADVEEDKGGLGASGSSYVPPHMRKGGAGGGEKMGGRFEKDDLATLRVTNVRAAFSAFFTRAVVIFGFFADFFFFSSNRSASWQRNRSCGISSNGSVVSPESSSPGIGKPRGPRASHSSAMQTVAMRRLLARRWMAVCFHPLPASALDQSPEY
jgi:translation initiation factor 3 subunit G